jgi:hypothetical protein
LYSGLSPKTAKNFLKFNVPTTNSKSKKDTKITIQIKNAIISW